jgi:uncharacterized protein (TIRG00374 family)
MTIGLIAFTFYLYFFVGFNELYTVIQNLNSTNYTIYYSLAITATILSILCISIAWQDLLKSLHVKTKLKNIFLYTWIGYFVDLIVPCQAVCGEAARIYLVHKENRENYGPIAASSLTNRIINYFLSSLGLLAGIILLFTRPNVPPLILQLLIAALIGTAIYLAALFYLAFNENAANKIAGIIFKTLSTLKLSKYLPTDLPEKTQTSLLALHEGFKTYLDKPKCLIKPFLFQFFSLLLNLSVYILVFYSLGITNLLIDFFIIIYFIIGSVQIAAAIFSVGILDIALANIFLFYGVPNIGLAAIATTLLRFLTFWMPIVVGYVATQVAGARRLLNPKARETIAVQEKIEDGVSKF